MLKIAALPHVLYRFYDAGGKLLYIGIAFDFLTRWRKHRRREWWPLVAQMRIEHHPTREAALTAERRAIIAERPRFNLQHNRLVTSSTDQPVTAMLKIHMMWARVTSAPWNVAGKTVRGARLTFVSLWLMGFWPLSAVAYRIVSEAGHPGLAMTAGMMVFLLCMSCWWLVALDVLAVPRRR